MIQLYISSNKSKEGIYHLSINVSLLPIFGKLENPQI